MLAGWSPDGASLGLLASEPAPPLTWGFPGGRDRRRSGDLALFRRALYQLSYPTGADLTGLEPATSTLTGWRALQLLHRSLIVNGTPNGIRTRAAALKGRCPGPLDDGGEPRCGRRITVAHDQPPGQRLGTCTGSSHRPLSGVPTCGCLRDQKWALFGWLHRWRRSKPTDSTASASVLVSSKLE